MLLQSKIESQKSKTYYQSTTPPLPSCPNVLFTGISEGNGLQGYVRHRECRLEFIMCRSSWMIRRSLLQLVIYLVTKNQKTTFTFSIKLHHIAAVILSVACILVISVISDSQCKLNKGRFHGSMHLLLEKYSMSLKSNMGILILAQTQMKGEKEKDPLCIYQTVTFTNTHTHTHTPCPGPRS